MDVDLSITAEDLMQYFDTSPEHFAWRAPRPKDIEVRRAHMSDMLLFDILLSLGGVRHPDSLFPPMNSQSLEKLLDAIRQSTYDTLKQDCLVYYLLKWHQDGREDDFREKRCIPPQFAALADAYWHLDSGINVARAVSLLSDARLNREYPSKILQALSFADDSSTLIRSYIRTANPLLTEPDDIDTYAIALAESSLMEAWRYQRSFSEASETRKRLIRKILDWCLSPKPRLTPLKHLLAFPFSPYEQSLVHTYALDPPSHVPADSVPVIQDLVCVRLIQSGQHAAAIKLDRQFSSVPRGGEKGLKIAQERRQMMDELMSAMPSAERYLLELELDNFSHGRGLNLSESMSNAAKPSNIGADLGMSWEHIAPPAVNGVSTTSIAPPTLPLPQRSNAPRFGGAPPPMSATSAPFTTIPRGVPAAPPAVPALQLPEPPAGPLSFGGAPTQPARNPNLSTSGLFGQAPAGTSAGPASNVFGRGGSLFDIAGSANSAPNAFYQPPPSEQKRSLFGTLNSSTTSRSSAPTSAFASLSSEPGARNKAADTPGDTSIRGPHDADINMLSDADSATADASMSHSEPADRTREEDDSPAGFAQSVFGNIPSTHTRPIATSRGSRIARTVTEAKLPPGAFLPEDDAQDEDEQEQEEVPQEESISSTRMRGSATRTQALGSTSARTRTRVRRSPSPEQLSTHPSTRSTRARKEQDLGRSIPGSLVDDDDDDDSGEDGQDEEEQDIVAPLPTPARRSSRKSRVSNGAAQPAEAPRVTRRSSRLSAVSSSSPEPVSPQKVSARSKRSGRASAAGAGASAGATKSAVPAKGSSRKRRS
ncbi:nuclear pore complex assembly-domain-containing protein [Trametes punicea]|nr:nuclear pore complex assembly-domain-containing protein [Trametes punicea]